VQPQEPATGPISQPPQPPPARGPAPVSGGAPMLAPAPPVGAGGGRKMRNRRGRLILALVAGVVGLLCLGGVGVFVSLYDEATEIKRTAPDAVTDNFLRAYLVNRDNKESSLFTCRSGADLTALSALREEMISREKNFQVKVSASWSTLTVNDDGTGRKIVSTNLIISGSSGGNTLSRRNESWSFIVLDEDGWRLCGAVKNA
jgi:hypothetical protein